jgi:hypothetical protein
MNSRPAETFSPHATAWAGLARDARARREGATNIADFRRDLGLPADRVIIMSGHQAEFWHPGIVAKFFSMHALVHLLNASGVPAAAAWIIVDQDDNDPTLIRFPALRGRMLTAATWQMSPDAIRLAGVPSGARAPITPTTPPTSIGDGTSGGATTGHSGTPAIPASSSIARGLVSIHDSMRQFSSAASLAEQCTRAALSLLTPLLTDVGITQPTHLICATALAKHTLTAAQNAHAMAQRPSACIAAYNAAAAAFPEAGIRPLAIDAARPRHELPLWRIRRGEPRMPVYAEQLNANAGESGQYEATAAAIGRIPRDELAPRALFMTALLRGYACDLFIHGLGGGAYDNVMEGWIRAWKSPEAAAMLAPGVVATATRLIQQPGREIITPHDAARAAWLAHRAPHDPGAIADSAAAARKREWLATLATQTTKPGRLAAYRAMHADLAAFRASRAEELARLARQAADARARAAESGVITDRTFAFPLHDDAVLADLRDTIFAAFAASAQGSGA